MSAFEKELEGLINRHSIENQSNTPDFMLAAYLVDCLATYAKITTAREKWYGREPKTGGTGEVPEPVSAQL